MTNSRKKHSTTFNIQLRRCLNDSYIDVSGIISCYLIGSKKNYFIITNFPILDGDVPRRPSYGVYISQLIRFARVCSHVDDFNTRNKCLTANFLNRVIGIIS